MAKLPARKQINGTYGSVWVNNDKWLDIEKFESKVTAEYEDVNMAEDPATHKKYTGWSGEGTITTKKVYSRGTQIMAEAVKTGIMPDIKIVAKLADPDAFGAERASFEEVTFNEFSPLSFEMKTLMTEELPFNFADFETIDEITA